MKRRTLSAAVATLFTLAAPAVHADAVTEWNVRAGDIMSEAKLGTPPAVRLMAMVQTAVAHAVEEARGANADAAIAAANRAVLAKALPAQLASIDAAYQAALAKMDDTPARAAGIAVGEKAATAVMARRADDVVPAVDDYRPHAAPGSYVPTAVPAVPKWSARKPWNMASAAQFRPSAPPALSSDAWARDYNEVKALGGKASTQRTEEQTQVAKFWDYSLPPIYFGVLRSLADQPGRDLARNARLYAAAAQGMDDALISVFEAKYTYNFWRPTTAIRNGDTDGNAATERDASWSPLIDAPMHPEFPSGHSILAASVGAVLEADIGDGPSPELSTTSPTLKGVRRRWSSPAEFVREVSDARIYAGIHYRSAVEAGTVAGRKIGALAANQALQPMRLGDAR